MSKEHPDHEDAKLVLELYELRREAVMRESRGKIMAGFWPRSYEEFIAITKGDHPLNAPFRQVSSYWEMVYGMAHHGIVHAEYFMESNGEGLFLYAKIAPYLKQFRADYSAAAFRHAEWAAENTTEGKRLFGFFRSRVEAVLAQPPAA